MARAFGDLMGKTTPIASDATRQRRQLLSGAMRLKGRGFDKAAEQLAGQAELVQGAGGIMAAGDLEKARADKEALQAAQDTKMAEAMSPTTEFGINKATGLAGLTAPSTDPLAKRQQFFNEQVSAIRSNTFNPVEAKKTALGMGISESGWAAGLSRMPAVTAATTATADKANAEKAAADKAAADKAAADKAAADKAAADKAAADAKATADRAAAKALEDARKNAAYIAAGGKPAY